MFNNSGSEWRKWDLHVHTPNDHEWHNRQIFKTEEEKVKFAKEYIAFAKNENLSVLGITDHNFCNSLSESILPHIIHEANQNGIIILPGFEITVKDGSGIHLLVLFKEKTELRLILDFVKRLFKPGTNLTPSSGVPVSEVTIDELKDQLNLSGLDYVIIFAHADRDNGVLDKATIDGTRRIQEWQKDYINICQLSKSPDAMPNSGLKNIVNNLIPAFSRNMAYITASDCRTIDKDTKIEGRHYLGQKFTWIKANPTLEGLKEIQYEPKLRVRIQETNPNNKIPYEVIKEVRFKTSDENSEIFNPAPIPLNSDLNVVIGGKSSGKSMLLYSIANTIDHKQVLAKDDSEPPKKGDKYSFTAKKTDFEVTWANGTKQLLSQNEQGQQSNYSILYLPQSYIQKLADTDGAKTRNDVGKIIRSILKQKEEYNRYYDDFLQVVKQMDSNRENIISNYITALEVYNQSLDNIKTIGDKSAILKYIGELRETIKQLKNKSEVTPEIQAKYESLRTELQIHNTELFTINNDKDKVVNFKTTFDRIASEYNSVKIQLISELKNPFILNEIEKILSETEVLNSILTKLDTQFFSPTSGVFIKYSEEISERANIIKNEIKPISEKFQSKDEIERLETLITTEQSKLDRITAYEEEVNSKKRIKDTAKVELLNEYRKTFTQYVKIIEKLNRRGTEISDLILKGSVKFYTKRFYDRLGELVNLRQSQKILDQNRIFENTNHIHDVNTIDEIVLKLDTLFDLVIDDTIVRKNSASKKDTLNALFKDDFFDYWEILSGKDEIANMSPGKSGLVLLKLLIDLSDSKCPILIDQPEDNLDNRSIYSDLVQYIRQKKIQRQFIVVTHNPNIVVGADAENVIVANQNDQDPTRTNKRYQFDYISGAIEHSFSKTKDENVLTSMGIREHVTEILEGGKEAFQKRESKYRYHLD